jgi:hypothetical protein
MDISYEERFGVVKPHTRLGQIAQKDVDKELRNRIEITLKILQMGSDSLYPTRSKQILF